MSQDSCTCKLGHDEDDSAPCNEPAPREDGLCDFCARYCHGTDPVSDEERSRC